MMSAMVARAALLVIALAAIGWLALGLRSYGDEVQAEHIAGRTATLHNLAAQRRALNLLDRARRHDPDQGLALEQAGLLFKANRLRAGIRVLEHVVVDEPDNVSAWGMLQLATVRIDPALSARAGARARKLAPPVAPTP